MEKFYTVKEMAQILRIHPNTVRKLINNNRLHPINVGSWKRPTYAIPEDDLLRLMAEGFKNKE